MSPVSRQRKARKNHQGRAPGLPNSLVGAPARRCRSGVGRTLAVEPLGENGSLTGAGYDRDSELRDRLTSRIEGGIDDWSAADA